MHMPCKIRLTFILLWCTHPLIAQKNFKHHYFEGYAQVLSMMQDSTGFLWIRSTSRLGRFDGYEMQTYFDSLGNNIVGQLTSDCSGRNPSCQEERSQSPSSTGVFAMVQVATISAWATAAGRSVAVRVPGYCAARASAAAGRRAQSVTSTPGIRAR